MTDAGKSWQKLSSARDQFRKVLLSYWALVTRWSTSAKVPNKCMKRWLTLGNVRLCWPPSEKFPNGGERSTPNVPDVNQNSELGNVNSTDVWTILSNVSKSELYNVRSPKRSQCESTFKEYTFVYLYYDFITSNRDMKIYICDPSRP